MLLWLKYLLIWPGVKHLGRLKNGDFVIAQAFGRNKVRDDELVRVSDFVNRQCQGNDYLAVIGLRAEVNPGLPNRGLAKCVQWVLDGYNVKAAVQWEIAVAFDDRWYEANWRRILVIWPDAAGTYPTARDILAEAMRRCPFRNIILVAHQSMIVRTVLLARRLGLNPIVPPRPVRGFDPHSVQWWTRGPLHWAIREIPGRWYLLLRRWV